jgi:hypothetical protein
MSKCHCKDSIADILGVVNCYLFDARLDPELDSRLDSGLDPILDPILDPRLDSGLEPLDSRLDS